MVTGIGVYMEERNLFSDTGIKIGDVVRHFKRELADPQTNDYLYVIRGIANHTETNDLLVIYQALYPPFKTYARPYKMFTSRVDNVKYPDIKQKFRFERVSK